MPPRLDPVTSTRSSATAWAPGRVNLIGEHLDYNGGRCLPVALPCGTSVRVDRRTDDALHLTSVQQPDPWVGTVGAAVRDPGHVTGWAAYVASTLWALDDLGIDLPGMDVVVDGGVPLGAGLSSSASLEAAVAVAVCALGGRRLDDELRVALVAACVRAETEGVGAPTGGLDQHAVLLAPDHGALLLDFAGATGSVTFEAVQFDPAGAGLALVVVDTRVSHSHTSGDYGSRRDECTEAARLLDLAELAQVTADDLGRLDGVLRRRARHVLTEQTRVPDLVAAAAAADWSTVGRLFTESHASLRDDFEVSCPELDLAVTASVEAGALGARMTGGGFGGSAIALVPTARVAALRGAVTAAFAGAGFAVPSHLDGTPGGPARVVDAGRSPGGG